MMAVLAWRLGLGWLVGRRLLLITMPSGRVSTPYRLFAGTFYVPRDAGPWVEKLEKAPAVTVQAWPGPRSVKPRRVDDVAEQQRVDSLFGGPRDVVALSPTGQRSPDMTAPDLAWVWPLVVGIVLLSRRFRRT